MKDIVITTRGLTKRFGELAAVDDLNLEIIRGEIFGFLGPNGAGKTTAIHMICGLLKPSSGQVLINGNDQDEATHFKGKFGLCPQEIILWPKLTCLEQLIFMGEMYGIPGRKSRSSSNDLLEKLGLSEKRNKTAATLSGGMKRRLNICLALVHDPEIVILDEPEAGLDPQSRVMTREFIRNLRKEKTVILTTHNMDEADRLSDRVAIIDYGRLLLSDTPEKLKSTVGEGDIIEITLESVRPDAEKKITSLLKRFSLLSTITANSILIRKKAAIEVLPEITKVLTENGILPGEIKMRANTLEDVFIQLTGRRLRE
ncbi:MAG: ABC transporter ATP-binding protein [Bacteroidales bacterium]|nr:ABC transporter ATP-binding protein [Bacteroidales bacterium]